jgi:polysaccharide deacetylase family protein (PEP-CTERM system associated)
MIRNYFTVDVEDYFHVSAFENVIGTDKWQNFPLRVEKNTRIILDLLDRHNITATFFVLGWVAQQVPQLVKDIADKGHELGCHSFFHRLVYNLSPAEFRDDTRRSKDLLEQISGKKVHGYRAPSYSITNSSRWALDILDELDFKYDSSIFPIFHDRYGIPNAPRFQHPIKGTKLYEFPISTSLILGKNIPVSGGGYFRLLPYPLTRMVLRRINMTENKPFIFYIHPWEIDPMQPKIANAGFKSNFRHYLNLDKTERRLTRLLKDFRFRSITPMNS